MNVSSASRPANRAVRLCWNVVRLPIAAALLLLEPVVQFVCSFVMVVGIFVAIMFEISAVGPRFPFLQVAGISLSFGLVLMFYYFLLSFFVAD